MTRAIEEIAQPRRSLGTQAVLLAVGAGVAQVLVALLYILAARESGPAQYGVIATAIAIGMSAMGFFDFGSNALWIRERAAGRMGAAALGGRATIKLAIATGLALIAAAASLVDPRLLVVACVFFSGTVAQVILVPVRAAKRGEIVAVMSVIERAMALGVFFLLLAFGLPALQALWISIVSGTFSMALIAYFTSRGQARLTLSVRNSANPWRGAKYYGFGALASSGQQLDLPVLSAVAGPTAAGVYSGVSRWTQPLGLLASAFSGAAAPFIAGAEDWKSTRRLITRASWLLVIAVLGCIALAVTAPWLVPFILGEQFAGSAVVLQWLAIGTIPAVLNQPLASALQARQHERLVAAIYLSAVVIQLALVALLGLLLGAEGAAIAYFILQIVMLVSLSVCVTRLYRREHTERRSGA